MVRASFGWQNNRNHITAQSVAIDPNNRWNLGGQNTPNGLATGSSSKTFVQIGADWQFNVTGMYQFPLGINFSANFFGRQGYPNPYYVRTSTFDSGAYRPRTLIGAVGDIRYENVYQLDLRLEKAFNLGAVSLIPTVEVFNVTNNAAVL